MLLLLLLLFGASLGGSCVGCCGVDLGCLWRACEGSKAPHATVAIAWGMQGWKAVMVSPATGTAKEAWFKAGGLATAAALQQQCSYQEGHGAGNV